MNMGMLSEFGLLRVTWGSRTGYPFFMQDFLADQLILCCSSLEPRVSLFPSETIALSPTAKLPFRTLVFYFLLLGLPNCAPPAVLHPETYILLFV